MTSKLRDANHAILYAAIKTKRCYQQQVNPHLSDLFHSMVDVTNALFRSILGIISVVCSLISHLCIKEQRRWYRKNKQEE